MDWFQGRHLPPPDPTLHHIDWGARGTLLWRWGSPQDVVDAVPFELCHWRGLFAGDGERWAHRLWAGL
jgi:hypothetical protein